MKSFKLTKSNSQKELKDGGILALALSIPLIFIIGLFALVLSLVGLFLILASYGE